MKKTLLPLLFLFLTICAVNGQNLIQNINGQVIDKATQQPLPGANVILVGSQPVNGTATDVNGYFKLQNVPVGRATVTISFLGYNSLTLSNLIITSGKEFQINAQLEEKVTTTDEVVIKASKSKSMAINEMATVSARAFTIEETERYAGSRGDVARMASNYAGVSFANDSRNDIVIRGNSPTGLLWKLEDMEVPNPNHFAENGTTGGPVGMLNNNVLKNSDFFTGAFPAEYGNAMSGVFDLKMRNGNAAKYEFTGQSGFNGFEFGAEGPIKRDNNSSFIIFYRYSTLELLNKMGVSFGTTGIPKYQDLNFKVQYPLEKGVISVFGIAGKSQISMLFDIVKANDTTKKASNDMYNTDGQNLYNKSSMAASGIAYTHFISPKSYIKFLVSGLYTNGGTDIDTFPYNYITRKYEIDTSFRWLRHDISEFRGTFSITHGTKFNSKLNSKFGAAIDQMGYDLNSTLVQNNQIQPFLSSRKSIIGGTQLIKLFYQISYKISDNIAINPGVHLMYFALNKRNSLEPRLGATWQYTQSTKLNAGYGLHSRAHALSVYYYIDPDAHNDSLTNKNADFTKAHHFVFGHDWNISSNLRLKVESYYQDIYNVPVEKKSSSFSILNSGSYWGTQAPDSLVNTGKGQNYGCEITFEKFLSNNYYFLVTTSLFDSKYRGSDKVWRNTAYNGHFVINALVGYEYVINPKWALAFDVKAAIAGGKMYTEVDTTNSWASKSIKYFDNKAFEKQTPDFFKMDVKLGIRNNMKGFSQEWQIYIENVTNHQNILYETYSLTKREILKVNQMGFFPMVLWRINF